MASVNNRDTSQLKLSSAHQPTKYKKTVKVSLILTAVVGIALILISGILLGLQILPIAVGAALITTGATLIVLPSFYKIVTTIKHSLKKKNDLHSKTPLSINRSNTNKSTDKRTSSHTPSSNRSRISFPHSPIQPQIPATTTKITPFQQDDQSQNLDLEDSESHSLLSKKDIIKEIHILPAHSEEELSSYKNSVKEDITKSPLQNAVDTQKKQPHSSASSSLTTSFTLSAETISSTEEPTHLQLKEIKNKQQVYSELLKELQTVTEDKIKKLKTNLSNYKQLISSLKKNEAIIIDKAQNLKQKTVSAERHINHLKDQLEIKTHGIEIEKNSLIRTRTQLTEKQLTINQRLETIRNHMNAKGALKKTFSRIKNKNPLLGEKARLKTELLSIEQELKASNESLEKIKTREQEQKQKQTTLETKETKLSQLQDDLKKRLLQLTTLADQEKQKLLLVTTSVQKTEEALATAETTLTSLQKIVIPDENSGPDLSALFDQCLQNINTHSKIKSLNIPLLSNNCNPTDLSSLISFKDN